MLIILISIKINNFILPFSKYEIPLIGNDRIIS